MNSSHNDGKIYQRMQNKEIDMKKIALSLLTLCIFVFPALSKAELVQGELYAGASVGVSLYDELDTTDVGYKVYGGYLLYDYVGLDIAYINLGNPKSTDVTGFSASAIGNFPVNNQISLFAKVGSFVWDYDPPGSSSSSGNDINFGAGVNFNAMDNIYIHGELERYKAGDETIIIYSLGLALGF